MRRLTQAHRPDRFTRSSAAQPWRIVLTTVKQFTSTGLHVTHTYRPTDIAGPIENSVAVIDGDYSCNLFLCRGYQYEDNVDNALALGAGDVVDIHIDIIAGHKPGYAVSTTC